MRTEANNAKNIMVKGLSEEDHEMLTKVRSLFNTPYNTTAIMKSGYEVLKCKTKIDELNEDKRDLQQEIRELKNTMRIYQEFFSLFERAKIKTEELRSVD